MTPSDTSLEQRIAALEDAAETAGPEGARLADSVERLGLNANALQQALLQVDRNQQTLTQLGTQLADVERSAATKTDLACTKAEQEAKTRQNLRRTYLIGGLLLLFLVLSALVVELVLETRTRQQIEICTQRNAQNQLIVDVLQRNGLSEDALRFDELLIDCEGILR